MAALTADVHIPMLGNTGVKLGIKAVGADTFYAGALVFADATNGKAQVVPAAADTFLGICAAQKVVTAADELVDVYIGGTFLIPFIGAAEVDAGSLVALDISATQTDNPADLVSAADLVEAADDILIGRCFSISGSSGWVTLHLASGISGGTIGITGWI